MINSCYNATKKLDAYSQNETEKSLFPLTSDAWASGEIIGIESTSGRANQSLDETISRIRITNEETQQDSCDVVGVGLCVGHGAPSECPAPSGQWFIAVLGARRRGGYQGAGPPGLL